MWLGAWWWEKSSRVRGLERVTRKGENVREGDWSGLVVKEEMEAIGRLEAGA